MGTKTGGIYSKVAPFKVAPVAPNCSPKNPPLYGAVVANLWHACQRCHSWPSLWAVAPTLQNRIHFQKGTQSQAAPKIWTTTWKNTAKARRTGYSPSAQWGTTTYPVYSFVDYSIRIGNIPVSYTIIFGSTILVLDVRLLWTFFVSKNEE